jgi:hypothetical protein
VQEHDYLSCPDGTEAQLEQRDSLINITGTGESQHVKEEIAFWKEMAGTLLLNLHGFKQTVSTIRQRYFDGEEIMFSDSIQSLTDLEKHIQELVTTFNDLIAKEPEDKINVEALRTVTDKTVAGRVSYLVNMAKAEALDAMGENRAAVELVERYLET